METEQLHAIILKALGVLEGKVDIGFTNTHQRLDVLNGKVATHEGRLNSMDVAEARRSVRMDSVIQTQGSQNSTKAKWTDRGLMFAIGIILQLLLITLIRVGVLDINPIPAGSPEEIQSRAIDLKAEAEKLEAQLKQ